MISILIPEFLHDDLPTDSVHLLAASLTVWCVAGEEEEARLPLLYAFLTVQAMSLMYTSMLMFFTVSNLFTTSFYTMSMACLVWMGPYLVTTTKSWLLVFITVAEVFGLLGQVIFVTKEQVEEKWMKSRTDLHVTEEARRQGVEFTLWGREEEGGEGADGLLVTVWLFKYIFQICIFIVWLLCSGVHQN